jgi:hypothetical protein
LIKPVVIIIASINKFILFIAYFGARGPEGRTILLVFPSGLLYFVCIFLDPGENLKSRDIAKWDGKANEAAGYGKHALV